MPDEQYSEWTISLRFNCCGKVLSDEVVIMSLHGIERTSIREAIASVRLPIMVIERPVT